jgi:ABC-type sugar transport system substrate-binding protein
MKLSNYIKLALAAWLSCMGALHGASAPKITMIVQAGEGDTFVLSIINFGKAAAEDLGVDFDVELCADQIQMSEAMEAIIASDNKPDYVLFPNVRGVAPRIMRSADRAGIKTFLFNAGLSDEQKQELQGPRKVVPLWIGEMLPDDEVAGYQLAKYLIDRAKEDGAKPVIFGMTGSYSNPVAWLRSEGLERAVKEDPSATLHQIVSARWQAEWAEIKTPYLLKRYPDTTIIWTANDNMAIGAARATRGLGKKYYMGGIDWTDDAQNAVRDGLIETTLGGHFMEAAWAIILMFDHHNGIDFAYSDGGVSRKSDFGSLNQANLGDWKSKFGNGDWEKIDFTQFSKALNPDLKDYEFSIDKVLEAAE